MPARTMKKLSATAGHATAMARRVMLFRSIVSGIASSLPSCAYAKEYTINHFPGKEKNTALSAAKNLISISDKLIIMHYALFIIH
jgi:hypothetical protein